ncbi:MAG: DMT family transporter [Aquabacterium sp.]|nr:DMT family transporter [Aquabacterium sp.]
MTGAAVQGAGRWLAVAALVFNAFTWGVSWWPFRQLGALGLHPLWLTSAIYSLAVVVLLLARPAAAGQLLRTRSLWWLVLASGGTNACFNWGMSIGDVVRVVLLFYLMPLWAVLLSHALLGERISRRGAMRVALALAGAMVVLWPTGGAPAAQAVAGTSAPGLLPDLLGLLGGFCFALNNVMLRREAQQPESARALAMFTGGAVVSLALAASLTAAGVAQAPPALAWGWGLAALGLAAWFLTSNLTLQYGAARLPANTTAVVMISEVFFASVSALALGAGSMGWREALGALMILGGALLAAVQRD